ncbi:Phist protein [Plasmodium gonderi]|uniref:Phist protein n=1 Tax=Plasmodium gonderi TaxID=77519 RepID=A0A1Y1JE47_PLAGO|nr:Phist protein [Plasmodium gonderi]GAW79022.1 Phist protein [Plasmodium gonderi]
MNPANSSIPIIVIPSSSSADVRKAISANKSEAKKNKCKSKKSLINFNLASLPYKVLFLFGVIIVLLQGAPGRRDGGYRDPRDYRYQQYDDQMYRRGGRDGYRGDSYGGYDDGYGYNDRHYGNEQLRGGMRRGDDRDIHYSSTQRSVDGDMYYGSGPSGDERTIRYSRTERMIDGDIHKNGDDRTFHISKTEKIEDDEEIHHGPGMANLGNPNPHGEPGDDSRTFHISKTQKIHDDDDPNQPGDESGEIHSSKAQRMPDDDDPRKFHHNPANPVNPDGSYPDDMHNPHHGPGYGNPHGNPYMNVGGRGPQGMHGGRRFDMDADDFGSRADLMRGPPGGGRGPRHGPRDFPMQGERESLPFGVTRAELQEEMTEEQLNNKIKSLRQNATVKEMFVLFNQVLAHERRKFVKMQEYIMQYSQYLQKTLLLPTPIRMKYWWRAHYNMTDELIKKERSDFQDFYAFVNRGQCQRWDFLYFVNAKRKSWDELRDLMKSIWMEILTYKMKKHSKL